LPPFVSHFVSHRGTHEQDLRLKLIVVVMTHERRKIVHLNITDSPGHARRARVNGAITDQVPT
jgi:hypothetical protein